jgi:hypothetical protein
MAKSKARKNHKQKVAARNTRIKGVQNQMKKYYANMQEYINNKMKDGALKPKSGDTETEAVTVEPVQDAPFGIQ